MYSAVEWCKHDFRGIEKWDEWGKDHHRNHYQSGNYRQSVIDHCRFHRDMLHNQVLAGMSNKRIDQMADYVCADNFIKDLFERTFGASA